MQQAGSLWNTLRRMIAVRKMHPAFAWGDFAWAENSNPALAAYWRRTESEKLLIIHNLSGKPQRFIFDQDVFQGSSAEEMLSNSDFELGDPGRREFELAPYQYLWLRQKSRV
jgi:maltose alpha-D-glucosyltransferase/alpha-amylase